MADKSLNRQDLRLMAHTEANRAGGDPSLLLDLLADALVDNQWEQYTDDSGKRFTSPYDFLTRPYPEGVGLDSESLAQLQHARHRHERANPDIRKRMAKLRDRIGEVAGNDVQALNPNGIQDRNKNDAIIHNSKPQQQGTSREYRIAVLKRDAPDIAERVISGEIKAAAGIREMNKRLGKPEESRKALNMVDARSAFKTLKKFMPEDVLRDLTDLLIDWRNSRETEWD